MYVLYIVPYISHTHTALPEITFSCTCHSLRRSFMLMSGQWRGITYISLMCHILSYTSGLVAGAVYRIPFAVYAFHSIPLDNKLPSNCISLWICPRNTVKQTETRIRGGAVPLSCSNNKRAFRTNERGSPCYATESTCENEFEREGRAFGISGVLPEYCVRLHTPGKYAWSMSCHIYQIFVHVKIHPHTFCSPKTSAVTKGTVGNEIC